MPLYYARSLTCPGMVFGHSESCNELDGFNSMLSSNIFKWSLLYVSGTYIVLVIQFTICILIYIFLGIDLHFVISDRCWESHSRSLDSADTFGKGHLKHMKQISTYCGTARRRSSLTMDEIKSPNWSAIRGETL